MQVFCCPQPVYITKSRVKKAQAGILVLPLIQPSWAATEERILDIAGTESSTDPCRLLNPSFQCRMWGTDI